MKRTFLFLTILLSAILYAGAQNTDKASILYDGLYVAKTGSVPAANLEIFTYLKFYDDGTVYLEAVTENDPAAVGKWFGRDKKFSQKGTYKIDGINILLQLNNKSSKDAELEGPQQTKFKGSIKAGNIICLTRDEETNENCFSFSKLP